MMELKITSLDGKSAGKVSLSDDVFGLEPRADILHRMVRYQELKRQQGTHKTKRRSEVTGTTKKIYKQKGTGGARHGDKKAPIFRGGGKAFGPLPRSHAIDLPKKVRALALKHALSAKAKADAIMVLDDAISADGKTKALVSQLSGLGLANALVIGGSQIDENFGKAAKNIPHLDVLPIQGINVYDILRRDTLVLTKAAVEALEERFK
jgi:large subunit ribosomal protein L4